MSALIEQLEERAAADDRDRLLLERDIARRDLRTSKDSLARANLEIDELRRRLDFVTSIDTAKLTPPRWMRQKGSGGHRGIVSFVLSDTHYDEVVRPEQVDFLNAYDRRIAEIRTKRAFEKCIELARDYVKGVEYDGIVLHLTGDTFSGNIHDELKETNEGTLLEAVVHWIEHIEAGINMLADDFGKVTVACVVGNHPRLTRKPRAKNRAQDNVEWLLYKFMERDYQHDERVSFLVSDSADLTFPIYTTTYLQTHGDQFRGGSGISGALAPLSLGQHRKSRRQLAAHRPYDWLVMGHWHTYMPALRGMILSGTLKGYDEFAYVSNFEPEPPKLAWWVTTPERGITMMAPVEPASRKAEGW